MDGQYEATFTKRLEFYFYKDLALNKLFGITTGEALGIIGSK
jgi:hypothetical protein